MTNSAELIFWDVNLIPDLSGKRAIVTGATSGLGWFSAQALAVAGAEVVLAVRQTEKARALVNAARTGTDRERTAADRMSVRRLDLAELQSIREFGDAVTEPVDYLLNNAGVMMPPLQRTVDGFELQFGVNHLGHMALTAQLWEQLLAAPMARVCTVSSNAHRSGEIDFGRFQGEGKYSPWAAYGQSKLANLLFAFELQRRAVKAGVSVQSVAAHPGYSATELSNTVMAGWPRAVRGLARAAERVVAQPAAMGALPGLYALVADEVPGGAYVGPNGWGEWRGYPKVVGASERARSAALAGRLWDESLRLLKLEWEI